MGKKYLFTNVQLLEMYFDSVKQKENSDLFEIYKNSSRVGKCWIGAMDTYERAKSRLHPRKVIVAHVAGARITGNDPQKWWMASRTPVCRRWVCGNCNYRGCVFAHQQRPLIMMKIVNTSKMMQMVKNKLRRESDAAMRRRDMMFRNPYTGKLEKVYSPENTKKAKKAHVNKMIQMTKHRRLMREMSEYNCKKRLKLCFQEMEESRRVPQYDREVFEYRMTVRKVIPALNRMNAFKLHAMHMYNLSAFNGGLFLMDAARKMTGLAIASELGAYFDENPVEEEIPMGVRESMKELEELREFLVAERKVQSWGDYHYEMDLKEAAELEKEKAEGWEKVKHKKRRGRRGRC